MTLDYKLYCGEDFFTIRNKIAADGRQVASILDIMKIRLEGDLRNIPITSGDAAVNFPDGSIGIDYDSDYLDEKSLSFQNNGAILDRPSGSVYVSHNYIGGIVGPVISLDQINENMGGYIGNNSILLALSRYAKVLDTAHMNQSIVLKYLREMHTDLLSNERIMTPLVDSTYIHNFKIDKRDDLLRFKPWTFSSVDFGSGLNGHCACFGGSQNLVGKK